MKKVLAAALLSAAIATPALAAELPVYAGVSVGSSTLPVNSATAVGFFAGYKFNKSQTPFMRDFGTLAVEGQYTILGDDKYTFGPLSVTDKVSSVGVDAVALFPIASVQHLSAFAKLGFASTSASTSCTGAGFACSGAASASGLVIGVGAQYDVDSKIAVRAGYQSYASNVSAIYAAGVYSF